MSKIANVVDVSFIVPMRNASTTVIQTLQSIEKQRYPVREIIIIDNASRDNSVSMVKDYSKKSKIPIKFILRSENKSLGSSFNEGVKNAKSEFVILMHSDCSLPTDKELEKLTKPLTEGNIVATYPTITLLGNVWEEYSFWEKCFFARDVGRISAGLATKFDCIRRSAYQRTGGIDVVNFGFGGFDADLHDKLTKIGKVVKSDAVVTHSHYLGKDYSLRTLFIKQKINARTYGRSIRTRGFSLIQNGIFLLVKPGLAILPFIPYMHSIGLLLLIAYSFLYTKRMYTTKSTLLDPRIIILPFLNVFSLYYETFWTAEAFLFGKNKLE